MKFELITQDNKQQYIAFCDSVYNSGVWHYPDWIQFQLASGRGKAAHNFAIYDDNDNIIAGGSYIVQHSSFGINFAYIPAGLLYTRIDDEVYKCFTDGLTELSGKYNTVFTQLDSITPINETYTGIITKAKHHSLHEKLPIPQWTNIIDLSMSEDEILTQMKPKGRYNIKLAEKKGVRIEVRPKEEVGTFYELLKATTERDHFRPNPPEYYRCMLDNIPDSLLMFALHEGDILCGGIFTYTHNQGLYYYGASSNIKRNLMSPYLLQWTALLEAKKRGCKYYDFMGIADPKNPNDQLKTVTDFKLKFAGTVTEFQTPYHIVHKPLRYWTYKTAKKIRKIGHK